MGERGEGVDGTGTEKGSVWLTALLRQLVPLWVCVAAGRTLLPVGVRAPFLHTAMGMGRRAAGGMGPRRVRPYTARVRAGGCGRARRPHHHRRRVPRRARWWAPVAGLAPVACPLQGLQVAGVRGCSPCGGRTESTSLDGRGGGRVRLDSEGWVDHHGDTHLGTAAHPAFCLLECTVHRRVRTVRTYVA